MENMIRYLFEYRDGRRIRNVGFVKIDQNEENGTLQIHGRGTFLKQADIRVYLFFMKRKQCYGIPMGELHGVQSILSVRLLYDREEIEKYTEFDSIKGLILDAGERGRFGAVWDESDLPIEQMRLAPKKEVHPFPAEEEEKMIPAAPAEIDDRESEEPAAVDSEEAETLMETDSEEAEIPVETDSEETETPVGTDSGEQEESGKMVVTPEEENVYMQEETAGPRYRKGSREDLMELPRKEWYLANNSFLLHGYYNYKHLLFIEEEEGFYIGVPGIYHPREARAADSFGFPEFRKLSPNEEEELQLKAQEKNSHAVFGYWCRKIR